MISLLISIQIRINPSEFPHRFQCIAHNCFQYEKIQQISELFVLYLSFPTLTQNHFSLVFSTIVIRPFL